MVDNGGYTMALISEHLTRANGFRAMFGIQPNDTWTQQAENVLISRNDVADITLEYTGQNGSIAVKQADVVLNTYPLDYTQNYTTQDSLNDLDYVSPLIRIDSNTNYISTPQNNLPTAQA